MPLKSLTENLGQHVAWGHLNFKSAAIFLRAAIGRVEPGAYSQWTGAQNLAQETPTQSQIYLCCAEGSMSGRLMSLNWYSVFWLRAELGPTHSDRMSLCQRVYHLL